MDVSEKLKLLESRYKSKLSDTIDQLEHCTDTHELIAICHKLAGSSGTFGFHDLSRDMKEFERFLIAKKKSEISTGTLKQYCDQACVIINRTISP